MLIKNKGMVKIFSQTFSDQNVFFLIFIVMYGLKKFFYYTKKFDNYQPLARFHEKYPLKYYIFCILLEFSILWF